MVYHTRKTKKGFPDPEIHGGERHSKLRQLTLGILVNLGGETCGKRLRQGEEHKRAHAKMQKRERRRGGF